MGRQVRMVPAHWRHPKNKGGVFIPCIDSRDRTREQIRKVREDFREVLLPDAYGNVDGVMPYWSEEQRTHFQMYESTTAGGPISPKRKSPEALARWLVKHKASFFAYQTTTYEHWLRMIKAEAKRHARRLAYAKKNKRRKRT